MALTGTYSRTLDEKHRLTLPKRLRDQLGESDIDRLFITPEPSKCLGVYAPKAFEALATRISQQSSNDAELRNFLRLFYARAEEVDLDKQGRVRLPERLMTYADLTPDVVLIGVQTRAEIWDRQRWESFLEEQGSHYDEIAARAFQ